MIKFVKTPHKNLSDPTDPVKTYALAQMNELISLEKFAAHISAHNSKYGKGDVMCVLTEAVDCMREQLLNGNKVQLGDLGSFWLALKSQGVQESVPDENTGEKPKFTAKNITGITVKWYRGESFDSTEMLNSATFEEVLTRDAQRKALKVKSEQLANGTYKPNGDGGTTTNPSQPDEDVHE